MFAAPSFHGTVDVGDVVNQHHSTRTGIQVVDLLNADLEVNKHFDVLFILFFKYCDFNL